ncbi:MAG TPA: alpha-1,2-fucosyltransferase [Xanthobacteraceae bacterium]|nr:alpha-1,2-fucosyltransferase [Xanthobacteraceae bacterium]
MTVALARSSLARADAAPLVVSRLSGGLGNQLFQYAAGRSLARRSGARLILDATAFKLPQERRSFALDPYPIDAEVRLDGYAYEPVMPTVKFPRPADSRERPDSLLDAAMYRLARNGGAADKIVKALWRLGERASGAAGLAVFAERAFDYDAAFERLGSRTYLVGYWQSPRYFADTRDLICRELALPYEPIGANAAWLARIAGKNSVCVHVRRGDYLRPEHFDQHGVCSEGYYARAMQAVGVRVDDPQFFVFSDDLAWCRAHIPGPNVAFVDANPVDAAHDELRLMAACRHHVIANSSLSWWGAWLGAHADQIVVAPDPWFSAGTKTPDLFPQTWIALPRD